MSETCSRCQQEVRFGVRGGQTGWWHRENVDHISIFGHIQTDEERAEIERQLDLPRERTVTKSRKVAGETVSTEIEETYTTRESDLARYRKSAKFRDAEELAAEDDEEEEDVDLSDLIESRCAPIDPDTFAPRSGIKQVINLIAKQGWDLRRCTHARGPYIGAKGTVLSISDTIVVGARGPQQVDGTTPLAVASWRDGAFDFAFIGTATSGLHGVDATTLKNWIKGIV